MQKKFALFILFAAAAPAADLSSSRLLRQPDISAHQIAFIYAGDVWTATRSGTEPRRLTHTPGAESSPRFSPDGRQIAFTRNGDVYVMLATGGAERRLTWHPQYDGAVGWTPDGRKLIIYSDRWRGSYDVSPHVFLLDADGGWPTPLPMPRATHASFAPDGRRFAYGPNLEFPLVHSWKQYRGGSLGYIASFDPASNTYAELPRGNWNDVTPMWHGDSIYFLSDREGTMNLYCYALASKKTTRLTDYTEWDVKEPSAGPDSVIFENGGWLFTLDFASHAVRQLHVALPAEALPTAEQQLMWLQAIEDVWRIYRDHAFSPATIWSEIKPRYVELIKSAAHWSDAEYVMKEMTGEADQSHIFLTRSEAAAPVPKTGLLGADFRVENGRYRIARIYPDNPDVEKQRGPLDAPGVNVREGDYLLAVNGEEIHGSSDLCAHLVGLANTEVRLTIADSPSGTRREIAVKPVANESGLRYQEWVRRNRARVAEATGGRVGYVHVNDVDKTGVEKFRQDCRPLRGKVAALIVDERNNTGGTQTLEILDWLERKPVRMMHQQRGQVPPFISPFIDGPKVMIANELSVSGGDELAYYFKFLKLGPLVGTRTTGGMIGAGSPFPVAGGWNMTVPQFGFFSPLTGEWGPENRGVEPDHKVELTPATFAAGRDPQLEEAIDLALEALKTYRKQLPEIPPYRPAR
jgi:C-terminal processing protease CtpA/Prc